MKVDFERLHWENFPSTDTPLNADNLNRLEEGVAGLYSDVSEIQEELGDGVGEYVTEWLDEHVTPGGSTIVVDDTLSITGAAADAKKTGDEIRQRSGLSEDVKQALLQLASKVAYIDDDGQEYYDALEEALYPPTDLVSISAVYTQSGTVYNTDNLDSLKSDLVVTAHMSDSTTQTVTNYALSGTLAVGTSTITITYGGKTTTFNVTVTYDPYYVTDGLFAHWDAINNQATGTHDSSATTWVDLINGHTWTAMKTDSTKTWSWENDALLFAPPSTGSPAQTKGTNSFKCTRPGTGLRTLEIVFAADAVSAECIGEFTSDTTGITNDTTQTIGLFATDNVFITYAVSDSFSVPDITDIRSISATYDSSYAPSKAYVDGEEVSTHGAAHTFRNHYFSEMILGTQNNSANLIYPYSGKIYAIRMYNRELTAEEIAHNHARDVTRFGLEV